MSADNSILRFGRFRTGSVVSDDVACESLERAARRRLLDPSRAAPWYLEDTTKEKLAELMGRDLGKLTLCAMMIDGIHVDEHLVLVALGSDAHGDKHVLGLYEGATENTTSCIGLLSDLEARGVRTDRAMLFVIDGSEALSKAIRAKFGTRALIQRCQVHKKRTVEDHLPDDTKRNAGRTI
jgi:putative transposase